MNKDFSEALNPAQTWYVLGAGAMGCLWGARLWQQGSAVTLMLRNEQALTAYRERGGITLEQYGMSSQLMVPAQTVSVAQGRIHRMILATKAQDALPALQSVRHRLLPETVIVLMQNGLAVHEAITDGYGADRVVCLSTSHGAFMASPFHVVHAGFGQAWLGTLAATGDLALLKSLLSLLPAQSMAIELDPAMARRLWLKLAVNCAINALTVIHDCPNGQLLIDGTAYEQLQALTREIEGLYERLPQAPSVTPLWPHIERVLRDTAENLSSTLQDHRRGRTTEIVHLNGYLCELAEARGLPCPENRRVLQVLQSLSR